MAARQCIERRIGEEARQVKEEWKRLIMIEPAVQHFCRVFVEYLDSQDTMTALEAKWDSPEKFHYMSGLRNCLQILISELSRPLIELEQQNERRAREHTG